MMASASRKKPATIFERFYRTEGGRSRDITGSGLGLAICKHIIEAHGQTIHVRSTEGVGTTIGFTLETKKGLRI
jgi:two-component system phosphate regulon sensor histidine kinase PhoR